MPELAVVGGWSDTVMGEKVCRTVEGLAYEIHLTLDCGGDGWVATVRQDGQVVGTCTGIGRDETLQAVLLQLRARSAVAQKVPVGARADTAPPPMGESLRSAKGKLPKRPWKPNS